MRELRVFSYYILIFIVFNSCGLSNENDVLSIRDMEELEIAAGGINLGEPISEHISDVARKVFIFNEVCQIVEAYEYEVNGSHVSFVADSNSLISYIVVRNVYSKIDDLYTGMNVNSELGEMKEAGFKEIRGCFFYLELDSGWNALFVNGDSKAKGENDLILSAFFKSTLVENRVKVSKT